MIRRGTWLALLILLALVGLSFYLRDQQAKTLAAATPTKGSAPLFDPAEGKPTFIGVESSDGNAVQFSRDEPGQWVLNSPEEKPADQAAAEAAATQIGALKVLSTVKLSADIVGLDHAKYTITVNFGPAVKHTLQVGSVTPINDGYYSQLDDGPFQVVDKSGLDALIGLLTKPPYQETPTPRASATPPASAMPEAATPTVTAALSTSAPPTATVVTATVTP